MNERQINILLVDDSEQEYARINDLLSQIKSWRFNLEQAATYETALEKITQKQPTVCLLNPRLAQRNSLNRLHQTFAKNTSPPLILLTTPDDQDAATKVMENGAVDYLTKDQINASSLERSIRYAVKYTRLKNKLAQGFQENIVQLTEKTKRLQEEVIQLKHQVAVRQESERQYRELFDIDIFGVEVLDLSGVITDCNITYERLLGYTRDEIISRHAATFTSEQGAKHLKKKLSLLKKRGYTEGEIELVCKDGSIIMVWRRFRALYNENNDYMGAVTYSRDITERMKAVRQISSLARALEQSPVAIMITDANGVVEYVNFRFTELTGYTYEETLGQNLHSLKSIEESPEIFLDLWRTIRAGEEWQGEFRNINKEGEAYWEALTIAPMYDAYGHATHFIAIQDNITERKQTEEASLASHRRVGDLMTEHINDLTSANEELQREINERKRAEKALQRSRARLKAQYKGIPVPTYTWQKAGNDLMLVDFNDAAEKESQRRIADFMGKPVREVFKGNPQVIADFERCLNEKTTVKREAPYTLVTTGETKYFVTTYNFVPPHLVLVHIQDITDHKKTEERLHHIEEELANYRQHVQELPGEQVGEEVAELKAALQHEIAQREQAEQALQESEGRLKQIAGNIDDRLREQYRSIPIPTYSWQRIAGEFILVDFNNAAAESMGKIVDFFGKSASEIFKDRPDVLADFERCYADKTTIRREAPYTLITTGETRYFVTTYNYVPPNMVIDHIQDITEYKQIEAELEEYRERLEKLTTQYRKEFTKTKTALEQETKQRVRAEEALNRIKAKFSYKDDQFESQVKQKTAQLILKNEELQNRITEQQQLEEELHAIKVELKAQYKGIPIPTYTWRRVDNDFILVEYNEAAEKSSQGRITNFMRQKASEIFKDRPQVLADFERCYTTKAIVKQEAPYRLVTTGEIRQFVTTYNFVPPNTVIVHIEDVTEHKQVEEALHVSQEQIELHYRLSPDLKLTFVNDAYCWYFHTNRKTLIDQPIPFILDEDRQKLETHFNTLNQKSPVGAVEYRVIKPDGSLHWQRWINRAIFDEKGDLVEFRSAGRDITRRKEKE